MSLTRENIPQKVESLRRAAAERDQRHRDIHDVRSGEIDTVMPGAVPDAWPKPIVANMVDTSARDFAEVMGTMPSINCTNSSMVSDRSKKFSSKRTKIAANYIKESALESGRQVVFCDHYNSYGAGVYVVEPDFDRKMPIIRVQDPMGTYAETDLFGFIKSFTKIWVEDAGDMAVKYPALISVLNKKDQYGQENASWRSQRIEVIKYEDADQLFVYLPAHSNTTVMWMPNPMGKVMVSQATRPGYDQQMRGAFDDIMWVQLAKAKMALLGLEATDKAVRAPLMLPRDVTVATFGADQIMRSDNPDKARYLARDMPQYAFQQEQLLDQEMRVGSRTPEARSGNVDASIITGKGVQALMGGFNTVIQTGQSVVAQALKKALELCFEMDEKLWPEEKKTIRGTVQGSPFEETYIPKKDINANRTVDVVYGFASGQDPARAIVALLQLRGDQLVSRDFVQRQLPMEIDVVQMQQQVDNEQLEDALKAGIQGFMQSLPTMALQGQDPTQGLHQVATIIDARSKGMPIHQAALEAFAPKAQAAPQGAEQGAMGQPPMGGMAGAPGAPQGPPGASQGGGMDMQRLLAGLNSNGKATMTSQTRRQSAI